MKRLFEWCAALCFSPCPEWRSRVHWRVFPKSRKRVTDVIARKSPPCEREAASFVGGGGDRPTKHPQANGYKGVHTDQGSPPQWQLFFTWLQWPCPLCGYAKKKKEKKKTNFVGCSPFLQNTSTQELLPPGGWRYGEDLWCSLWCSLSFLTMFPKMIIILEKDLLYLMFILAI